ncbi:hypothetical protein ATERTT37_006933 [Aspergillus terreus]
MVRINYRMRVTLNDGRQMTGQMLAFDKHMNLVLADTEEFRRVKRKSKPAAGAANAPLVESEEKRTLGLAIVRGTHVVSCSVDGPPPADPSARLGTVNPLDVVFQSALEVPPPVWEDLLLRRAVSLASPRVVSPVLLRALRLVEDLQVDLGRGFPPPGFGGR